MSFSEDIQDPKWNTVRESDITKSDAERLRFSVLLIHIGIDDNVAA